MVAQCGLSAFISTMARKQPSKTWQAWEHSRAHHVAMIARYEEMQFPVQGERWRQNTLEFHRTQLAELEASEPPKFGT